MRGYVARRRDRYYAVIYEGIDPITGRERRRWHPAGTDRDEAQRIAARIAAEHSEGEPRLRRAPTLGVYLTKHWLPTKEPALRPSTFDGYRRNIELHVLPAIGRVPLRHVRAEHLERLYASLLDHGRARRNGGLDTKTVHEIHMVLRRALGDAVRRGILIRNPAELAHAPKRRPIASTEMRCWNASQLNDFLQASSAHPLYTVFWLAANTGMRRGELLGLRWEDIDLQARRLSVNRSLVSVGYELHESRGKTRTSRRSVDLDPRTVQILEASRDDAVDDTSPVFRRADGGGSTPRLSRTPSSASSPARVCPASASTTFDTPTPRCSSKPAFRSRSSASDSATQPPGSPWPPINTCYPACNKKPPAPSRPSLIRPPVPPGGTPGRTRSTR